MKLKMAVTDINEVPEALREYYTKSGDEYVLDSDDGLKSKVDEFRSNNIELRRKQEAMAAQLEAFKNVDPTKVPEAMAALERLQEIEEQNLIDAGKMDEVLAQRTERMRADLEGKNTALQDAFEKASGQAETYKGRLSEVMIESEISRAISNVGVLKKGAIDDLLFRAKRDWVVDEDGRLLPMRDGEVIYGKGGKEQMTPKEWGEGVFQEANYLFEPNSGGGGGGGGGGSPSPSGQIVLSDQEGLNTNLEDIASGKVVVVDG